MVVSVGIDVVMVERFARALERTPLLADRLFTAAERCTRSGRPRSTESLAARFAAKEAVAKALGAPAGLIWQDCEVVVDGDGRPWLTVAGTVAAAARERGIDRWHLSLSHDGGIASAMVVADSGAVTEDGGFDAEDGGPARDGGNGGSGGNGGF